MKKTKTNTFPRTAQVPAEAAFPHSFSQREAAEAAVDLAEASVVEASAEVVSEAEALVVAEPAVDFK